MSSKPGSIAARTGRRFATASIAPTRSICSSVSSRLAVAAEYIDCFTDRDRSGAHLRSLPRGRHQGHLQRRHVSRSASIFRWSPASSMRGRQNRRCASSRRSGADFGRSPARTICSSSITPATIFASVWSPTSTTSTSTPASGANRPLTPRNERSRFRGCARTAQAVLPQSARVCPECGKVQEVRTEIEHRDGELVELGARPTKRNAARTIREQEEFHGELRWIASVRGYAPGWAAHKFRERFGIWPNDWQVRLARPREPSLKTKNWLRSRQIAFAKGRALMAKRPKRKERGSINGAFAWRLVEMLESPAYRVLSLSAHRVMARLEIELAHHGGKPEENGKLPCTFDHFVEFGLHRHAIAPAIRELVALGFVEITQRGSAGNADFRQPTLYRLTIAIGARTKRPPTSGGVSKRSAEAETRRARAIAAVQARAEKQKSSAGNHHWPQCRKPSPQSISPVPEAPLPFRGPETITTSNRQGAPIFAKWDIQRSEIFLPPSSIGPRTPIASDRVSAALS